MNTISIVFPVHNEIDNLEKLISSWHKSLSENNIDHEFVIVEDGSTDGTIDLIKKLELSYPIINLSQKEKRGYSKAVVDGINNSSKKFILCTDSDNQIKVDSLIENFNCLPEENEFLIGYRNPRKDPWNRLIYSQLFKVLHNVLFQSKLKDPSCPFVLGLNSTFKKLDNENLLLMKEGFWWGFVAISLKTKIKFIQKPIVHFERLEGEAGYQLKNLPGIIFRNILGLIKIKFLSL
jgi:glycosyltransferase involved in cell wall biosynthesis